MEIKDEVWGDGYSSDFEIIASYAAMNDSKHTQTTSSISLRPLEGVTDGVVESKSPSTLNSSTLSSKLLHSKSTYADGDKTKAPVEISDVFKRTQRKKVGSIQAEKKVRQCNLRRLRGKKHLVARDKLTCPLCPVTYKNRSHYRQVRHVRKSVDPKAVTTRSCCHRFPCPSCPRVLFSRRGLSIHRTRVHKKVIPKHQPPRESIISRRSIAASVIPCTHCDINFRDRSSLGDHLYKEHSVYSPELATCEFCLRGFPGKSGHYTLRRHVRIVHQPKWQRKVRRGNQRHRNVTCFVCKNKDASFLTSAELAQHAETKEHLEKMRSKVSVHCNTCKVNFHRDIEALQVHLKSQQHLSAVESLGNIDVEKFCVPCRQTFDSRIAHNRSRAHVNATQFQRKGRAPPEVPFEVPTKCHACSDIFTFRSDLERHMKRFHAPGGYTCESCGDAFIHKKEFLQHRNLFHRVPKDFLCEKCGKKFEHKKSLACHIRQFHKGETCLCAMCGKTFPTPVCLSKHLDNVHNKNKRPRNCYYCPEGVSFYSDFKLRRHLHKNHVEEYLQKGVLLACIVCFHVFPLEGEEFQNHMVGHSHLRCPTCGKYTCSQNELIKHLKVHTRQKPFECPHCEKKYTKKWNLKAHHQKKHELTEDSQVNTD